MASELAKEILRRSLRVSIIALRGDLGSGKTTFLQGFARGLLIKERILSPTFVIMRKFKIPSSGFDFFYHFDCYRLKRPKELLELGFKEIIQGNNIVALEWPEKVEKALPRKSLKIKFETIGENKRKISYEI